MSRPSTPKRPRLKSPIYSPSMSSAMVIEDTELDSGGDGRIEESAEGDPNVDPVDGDTSTSSASETEDSSTQTVSASSAASLPTVPILPPVLTVLPVTNQPIPPPTGYSMLPEEIMVQIWEYVLHEIALEVEARFRESITIHLPATTPATYNVHQFSRNLVLHMIKKKISERTNEGEEPSSRGFGDIIRRPVAPDDDRITIFLDPKSPFEIPKQRRRRPWWTILSSLGFNNLQRLEFTELTMVLPKKEWDNLNGFVHLLTTPHFLGLNDIFIKKLSQPRKQGVRGIEPRRYKFDMEMGRANIRKVVTHITVILQKVKRRRPNRVIPRITIDQYFEKPIEFPLVEGDRGSSGGRRDLGGLDDLLVGGVDQFAESEE
ncbi:hypothetical protein BJ875DRAFT_472541 [Amylocarpus encephaloides]|uniref:Uncharacterized protein n=1 Tax=Amylocarpus encephaloides TaxID=45428 RepID=A0A9P7YAV1_9HELO|nr:hypothetical protein BJ875DRAFT_472541 [Amylocarpus encephaloides]